MKYRAEIDGLRALAIVPVILFHAGIKTFSGGYVGVDVFFVISGYLITTLLVEDIEKNRFSLVGFYERRARRILPALFFVMMCCIPFAWMWMLPSQLKEFSHSLIAVSIFASNVLFWRETGYFMPAVDEKPLLHTWSLAVEEQYYLLFPIFLFLAWRFRKNTVFWMIVALAGVSLALSEWGSRNEAIANFYLAPTRAWELFAGSIASFIVQRRGVVKNNWLALAGLLAITASIFLYDKTTPFPSVYALLPVSGAVLILLYASAETFAARLLSLPLLVGMGLISYSAYLWHQPIFAFTRLRFMPELSTGVALALSVLAIVMAFFSWKFIEAPFRNKKKISRQVIFKASAVALLLPIGIGVFGHLGDGFSNRLSADGIALADYGYGDLSSEMIGLNEKCDGMMIITVCGFDRGATIMVWGDSFAKHAVTFVETFEGKPAEQMTLDKCPPFIATLEHPVFGRTAAEIDTCRAFNRAALDYLTAHEDITSLVIGSRFTPLEGMSDADVIATADYFMDQIDALRARLKRPVDIKLFPPPPVPVYDVSKCTSRLIMFGGKPDSCNYPITALGGFSQKQQMFVQELQRRGLAVYPLADALCPSGVCTALVDRLRMFRDDGHLRNESGTYLAKRLREMERS